MTGEDILDKIKNFVDVNVGEDQVMDGIEEAINWLGVYAYAIDKIDMTGSEGKKVYDLPDNIILIMYVEDIEEEEYYYNYLVTGNEIRFKDDGNYYVVAQVQPEMIENIDDEISLHPMLQNCILTYVKGFVKMANDDESEVSWRYIEKFERDAMRAYEALKRNQKTPTEVKVIR